ncbi:MAG TPA: hypothetical protein VIL17_00845 [Coriobacteriia bacterium]
MQESVEFGDDALLNLCEKSNDELRSLLDQMSVEEDELSFRRRVLHGKIDILRAELVRRLTEGRRENHDVISGTDLDRLIAILASDLRGSASVPVGDTDAPKERRAARPQGGDVPDLSDSIRVFLEGLSANELEERVIEYVVREVGNGRKLADALKDPYVRNRLSEEKLSHVLETPEVIAAVEGSITSAFKSKDFGFTD